MPTKKGKFSAKERKALKALALATGTAVATLAGGPAVGAEYAAIMVSPVGQILLDATIDDIERGVQPLLQVTPMAQGGLVTNPTLALLGEAGPEMVVPLTDSPKRTRKKTDYDRRLKRALLEVNKTARLKSGAFRKGWDMSKVMKKAHKLARKYGPSTKKGQVRKTARRAFKR